MTNRQVPLGIANGSISRREVIKGMGAAGLMAVGGNLLAACAPQEPDHIRTQFLWILNTEFAGFYAAEKQGFYEDEKLTVDLLAGGPGVDTLQIMDSKAAEIGFHGSGTSFLKAVAAGSKLKVFCSVFQRSPAGSMYLMDNPIATPEDAAGKRIGLQGGATSSWNTLMSRYGLDPEKDMEIVSVGWDPSVLADGTVDGYWCYATNQPGILRLQGYDVGVLDPWEWGYRTYGNFGVVHEDYLAANKDAVTGYTRASIKGWEYANTHIDEMTQYTLDTYGADYDLDFDQQKDEATSQIDYMVSDLTEEKGLFWFDLSVWEEMMDILIEQGELDERMDASTFTTFEILEGV